MSASEIAGERFWPMPMDREYEELIQSDVADVKQTGGRWGGAIAAAKVLSRFVDDRPWAHLDIAGMNELDRKGPGKRLRARLDLAFDTFVRTRHSACRAAWCQNPKWQPEPNRPSRRSDERPQISATMSRTSGGPARGNIS